jgi:hypothetical protein
MAVSGWNTLTSLRSSPKYSRSLGPRTPERQRKQGPQVNHRVIAAVVFAQFVDLGVAVVAGRDTVVRPGGLDLVVFQLPVLASRCSL